MRYTQWHTTALCSPTRSCLLTGRNHTRNSMACITEAAIGFPNGSGTIPPENGMLSEILGERGWNTYMVGKWHLCPTDEMNLASTRRNWPSGRGFERWYGFLGAETNQWYPDLVYDNHPVDQPRSPEEGYHLTEDLTDKALEFINDAKAVVPEKPFFLYYAPGACHAPHHAPKEWTDRFKGRFDMGYEAIRETILARQKELGIVPAGTELPPVNPIGTPETRHGPDGQPFPPLDYTRPWGSLNADERRLFARMAEVYAGFLAHADHHIGRLLDYLEQNEYLDNTMIVVVSDNGASRRGRPQRLGQRDEVRQRHRRRPGRQSGPDRRAGRPPHLQPLPDRVGHGLQHAVQDVEALRVQRRAPPTRASSPGRPAPRPEARSATSTTTPSTSSPPSWTCSASSLPETIKGHVQSPLDGLSMRASFDDPSSPSPRKTQFYAMLGSRSIWHEGWKAVTTHPAIVRLGPLQRRRVGALPHRRRPQREPQPGRRAPRQGPGTGQHMVLRSGGQPGLPPRRPVRAGDPRPPPGPSSPPPATATCTGPGLPLSRSGKPSTRGAAPTSSAPWSTSRPREPRACCSPWGPASAATPFT